MEARYDKIPDTLYEEYYNSWRLLYPIYEDKEDLQQRRRSTAYVFYWHLTEQTNLRDLWENDHKLKNLIKDHLLLELSDEPQTEDGKKQQTIVKSVIYDLCQKHVVLLDFLFAKDKIDLNSCNSNEDYERYITQHPNTYPEYLLKAEYHIAVLTHTPFANLQRAKKEYGDCEWVQKIESEQTKSGITYMITEDIAAGDKQLMISFLESFSRMHFDNNEGITKRNDILVSNYVVTEKIWNIVMGKTSLFMTEKNRPKLIKYDEIDSFIKQLQKMLCVIFRMPTINERAAIAQKGRTENEVPPHVWEWCQPIVENTTNAPVMCVVANQDVDDNCLLEYNIPKSCYAGCRLVIEV